MNELQQTLFAFWSQFAPAHLSGHVPDGAAFPYITFDLVRPDAFGWTVLSAFVWCRRGDGLDVQAQVNGFLDQIAAAIPPEGVLLPVGKGYIILQRNTTDFQTLYKDPEDPAVIGGRTSYIARYFGL